MLSPTVVRAARLLGLSRSILRYRMLRLTPLQAAEFLYEQPSFPEPKYTFKHALTQDVAYASLPREQGRRLHERAAQAIEVLFHDRLGEYYSRLAHHYSRTGNAAKGVGYLQQAGQQVAWRGRAPGPTPRHAIRRPGGCRVGASLRASGQGSR